MFYIKGNAMLSYFTIQNFRSILDLTLNLCFAEGKLPNGYKDSEHLIFIGPNKKDTKLVPTFALYGANASGKTNIILALAVFKRMLLNGINGAYVPNKLNTKYNFTTFEMGIILNGKLYVYTLQYNGSGILYEKLHLKSNPKAMLFEIKNRECFFDNIATKEYTASRLKEIYKVECQNEQKNQWLPFLTCMARGYKGLNKHLLSVWNAFIQDIEVYAINQIPPLPIGLEKLAKTDDSKEIEKAFEKIITVLKKLDIDINKMTIERKKEIIQDPTKFNVNITSDTFVGQRNNVLIRDTVYTYHTNNEGKEIVFNFNEESDGTKILSNLLGICLAALDSGKTICIDELETSLHPLLLIEVVRLFKNKKYNTKGAQLIFTAHNTDILDNDLMRVSEIGIINKTVKNGTTLKRLSDFEIRNISNFRKRYLQGLFSGIPYPYI